MLKKIMFAGFAAAGCLTVVFLASEFLLGLRYPDAFVEYRVWGHKKSVVFGFEAEPSHSWKAAGASYSTDKHGFRTHVTDPEWDRKKKTRIFTLGASSVFGYGLNDDETWTHLLEKRLTDKGEAVDVINAGNNGHNSLQAMLRFYLRVRPFAPDYVVYYEGVNDVTQKIVGPFEDVWISDDVLFTSNFRDFLKRSRPNAPFYERTLTVHFIRSLWTRFRNEQLRREQLSHPVREMTPESIAFRDAGAERFILNVRTLIRMMQDAGVRPVLVTFLHDPDQIGYVVSQCIYFHNEKLRGLAKELDVPLIDLEKEFASEPDKQSYFFEDRYHPNRKGAAYISEKIADGLIPLLDKKEAGNA